MYLIVNIAETLLDVLHMFSYLIFIKVSWKRNYLLLKREGDQSWEGLSKSIDLYRYLVLEKISRVWEGLMIQDTYNMTKRIIILKWWDEC